MEKKDKNFLKHKIGFCIRKIIEKNKSLSKGENVSTEDLVTSLRKLAASSGIEYAIIQKIASGKKNPAYTTLVAIAEGFNITLTEFFQFHDSISDSEIENEMTEKKRKRKKNEQLSRNKTDVSKR
jgi:transcriptional regulator with XRE-family HTH domain